MKEKEREQSVRLPEDEQEELVRRLLRLSGGRPAVPGEVANRVRESVHSHWKQSVRARSRKRFAFIFTAAVAASLLIFFLANYLEKTILPEPVSVAVVENQIGSVVLGENQLINRGAVLVANSTLETGLMGRALLRTAQDVTMRLDVNTRVRFESESSFVLEQGAIYLDSGPQHKRFQVSTPLGDVANQGTQFEIRLGESKMEVRVREGSVSLTNEKLSRAVTAGKRLTVN
ncbi:MAG: FecR domain-containing protein, partial [Acidobacteriota bacterium]